MKILTFYSDKDVSDVGLWVTRDDNSNSYVPVIVKQSEIADKTGKNHVEIFVQNDAVDSLINKKTAIQIGSDKSGIILDTDKNKIKVFEDSKINAKSLGLERSDFTDKYSIPDFLQYFKRRPKEEAVKQKDDKEVNAQGTATTDRGDKEKPAPTPAPTPAPPPRPSPAPPPGPENLLGPEPGGVTTRQGMTKKGVTNPFVLQNVYQQGSAFKLNSPTVKLTKKVARGADTFTLTTTNPDEYILIPVKAVTKESRVSPAHWTLLLIESSKRRLNEASPQPVPPEDVFKDVELRYYQVKTGDTDLNVYQKWIEPYYALAKRGAVPALRFRETLHKLLWKVKPPQSFGQQLQVGTFLPIPAKFRRTIDDNTIPGALTPISPSDNPDWFKLPKEPTEEAVQIAAQQQSAPPVPLKYSRQNIKYYNVKPGDTDASLFEKFYGRPLNREFKREVSKLWQTKLPGSDNPDQFVSIKMPTIPVPLDISVKVEETGETIGYHLKGDVPGLFDNFKAANDSLSKTAATATGAAASTPAIKTVASAVPAAASASGKSKTGPSFLNQIQTLIGAPAEPTWTTTTTEKYIAFIDSKKPTIEGTALDNIKSDWKNNAGSIAKVNSTAKKYTGNPAGLLQFLKDIGGESTAQAATASNNDAATAASNAPAAATTPTATAATAASPAAPAVPQTGAPAGFSYVPVKSISWTFDGNYSAYGAEGVTGVTNTTYQPADVDVATELSGVSIANNTDPAVIQAGIRRYLTSGDKRYNPTGRPLYLTTNLNNAMNGFAVREYTGT